MQALEADDPRQVGEYRLLRRLGAGGMGRVYLGRTAGGRTVAVKLVRGELAEDPEFRARFRQEVAAARRVGGAWTAPVLDADTEGPHPWVATGYVAGPALGSAVARFGPLPEPAVRSLGTGLAQALEHVHGLGLVHRDVKPSNVLLTLDGPRLIDFGISRALDATAGLTRSGYVVGSPGFMSPEQAAGRTAGPEGDVFSLGAVLAAAATGRQPFGEGLGVAVLLYRVLHEEPDLTGLTGPLLATVRDCLAKDPAARPTPRQLRERLDPDGSAAARLGPHGGWLPPALAAAVGRSAVLLLDLEAEDGTGGPAAAGAGAPTGGWTGPGSTERVVATGSGTGPGAGTGAGGTGAGDGGGGTGSGPAGRGRARGPLAVGGALVATAALGVGGWLLVDALRGEGDPTAGGGRTGPPPTGATGSTDPTGTSGTPGATGTATGPATGTATGTATGPSVVPTRFLGTWSGEVTTQSGVPGGVTTLVIGPAAIGQENTTSRNANTGIIDITCEGAWKLTSASEGELVFTSRLTRSSIAGICTDGSSQEKLTLQKDGTIRFTSVDPRAGNPSGTLRRTG